MTDSALDFLLSRHADRQEHVGGTLYQHLRRVEAMLAAWGADETVRTAGLCHATYGTDGFAPSLLDVSERDTLAGVIGAEAEALVYLYGSCDRAAVYPRLSAPDPVPFRDRFTGETHHPDELAVRAFVEISAANELDVITHSAELDARHGPGLRALFTGARHRLSPAAVDAWS